MRRSALGATMVLALVAPTLAGAEVTTAVAANFLNTAKEIAANYTAKTGDPVRIISGSSGKLTAMILNGAPIDVFLSADAERPDALEKEGLVASRGTYAFGRLALYAPMANSDAEALKWLEDGNFRRVAIAEPRLAPYGRAAMEILEQLELAEVDDRKIAIGENIGQTFGFVATGNAELGFVALSQIGTTDGGSQPGVHVFDQTLHAPIRQDAVLLTRAEANPEAQAFFATLFDAESRMLIGDSGYEVPDL